MAENFIRLPLDGTGKKTRTFDQATSSDTVHTSVVLLGDASNTANTQKVTVDGFASVSAMQSLSSNLQAAVFQANVPWIIQGLQSNRSSSSISIAPAIAGPVWCDNFNVGTVTVSGAYNNLNCVFEGSDDDGATWYTMQGARLDAPVLETGAVGLSSTNRGWDIALGAITQFRVRVTSLTNGSVGIGLNLQSLPYEPAPIVGGTVSAYVVSNQPPRVSTTAIVFQNINNTSLSALTAGPYNTQDYNVALVTISGQYTGLRGVFEASDDSMYWYPVQGYRTDGLAVEYGPTLLANAASSYTGNYAYQVPIGGFQWFRYRNMGIVSGTAFVGASFESLGQAPGQTVSQLNPNLLKATVTGFNPTAANFLANVGGLVATGAALATNQPVPIAGVTISSFPKGLTSANNNVVNPIRADQFGRLLTIQNSDRWHLVPSSTAIATTAESIFLPQTRALTSGLYGGAVSAFLGTDIKDFPTFIDILELMVTNQMAYPIRFDIRCSPGSAIMLSFYVAASATFNIDFNTPLRQVANNYSSWTISADAAGQNPVNYFVFASGAPNR